MLPITVIEMENSIMTENQTGHPHCPMPVNESDRIKMSHGAGGTLTQQLIDQVFKPAFSNPYLDEDHDGAVLPGIKSLAITTDSYVVKPMFFPGGDIGTLAVNGTLNDLAMCGARPLYLTAGFIIEEGLKISALHAIVNSMAKVADKTGVKIITGDTKVIEKNEISHVMINTTGIGEVIAPRAIGPRCIVNGDVIIVSGDIARHGIAVMAEREGLSFKEQLSSDCASISQEVLALIEAGIDIHCLRDPTRGGLATVLVELATSASVDIEIEEKTIPLADEISGACEILGLDPLYVACEGRFVIVVPSTEAEATLTILRQINDNNIPAIIGKVRTGSGKVISVTSIGTNRPIDRLSGEQMPRIC